MNTVFDPVRLGSLSLPCRLVRSATAERIAMDSEGDGERMGMIHGALVRGGVGLIITGHIAVSPSGRVHPLMAGLYTDRQAGEWRRAVERIHRAGGRVVAQINHGGGRCPDGTEGGPRCVSPLPDRPKDPMRGTALTGEEIAQAIAAFTAAARRARDVGMDGVEIHGAHGYLGSQFLSPATNLRTDEWGGTLEGRARFLRAVVREVRQAVGPGYPVGMKLGALDDPPNGLTVEESLLAAEGFVQDGLDFVEVSGGFHADVVRRKIRPGKGEGYYVPVARRFKERLSIPVIVVGGLRSLTVMNEAIGSGSCDAVAMCRPLICEPDLPQRLQRGEASGCIGCNLCLFRNDAMTVCHAKKRTP